MVTIRQVWYGEDSYDEEVITEEKVIAKKVRKGKEVERVERERKPVGKPQF
jgi:hypothetical protein